MPKFYFRKLVRDKVIWNCLNEPETLETNYRALDSDEFVRELIKKVTEEAAEIDINPGADRQAVLTELADLQTVVDTLRQTLGFTTDELKLAMEQKISQKGDFSGRNYIEYVVLADDSPWIDYFRANPCRYPEE